MGFTKFATFEDATVLEIKGSPTRLRSASLDKLSDYENYRTGDGYMYVRIRAISSRVNKNHDGWPSVELAGGKSIFERHAKQSSSGFTVEAKDGSREYGFATFLGKPNFIDHNNSDPSRARGVVVDAKLRVLPQSHVAALGDDYWTSGVADPEHLPPTEIELLIEIDARSFPKYASAVRKGELDGFSMGCDVDMSKCSHCGHEATNPTEYCSHILMKGAYHDFRTADGHRVSKASYENCYGIKFFEISGVFEPADETALAREVVASIQHEGIVETERPGVHLPDPLRGHYHGEVAQIAHEIKERNPDMPDDVVYDLAQRRLTNPAGTVPHEESIEDHDPKRWEYTDMPGELPPAKSQDPEEEFPGAIPNQPVGPLHQIAEEAYEERWPGGEGRPVRNDPRWSGISEMNKTAEAPEPQSDQVKAPNEVDTMRQEKICPLCGNVMDSHTCDVCNYEEPPEGFGNPDLDQARHIREDMKEEEQEPQPEQSQGSPPPEPQSGSFLQNRQQTRNPIAASAVMSEMRWAPQIDERLAGRINKQEVPVKSGKTSSGEPAEVTIIKNPTKPVTATMRTAQQLIQATKENTMSTHTADSHGATPVSDTAADARVDVTGVGGVIDASNEAASKATGSGGAEGEHGQTDVLAVGSTGVDNVEADKEESLPTASEKSDDSGFNHDKITEAIPTKTYGDSDGTESGAREPVTTDSLEGNQNTSSYDPRPFFAYDSGTGDLQDGTPGAANKGTQPADPAGKAEDRVDVLQAATSPDNNSGPTSQWTGTGGNKVYRQQDPVTPESIATEGFTSHVVASLKLADLEVDLGITPKEKKYDRISELEAASPEAVTSEYRMLSKVRTAGLAKMAKRKTSMRLPGSFGQSTLGGRFATALDGEAYKTDLSNQSQPVELTEEQVDSALFSR